jgi:hypothetical protein
MDEKLSIKELYEAGGQYKEGDTVIFSDGKIGVIKKMTPGSGIPLFEIRLNEEGKMRIAGPLHFKKFAPKGK